MKNEYLAHVDFEKAAQLLQIVDKCAAHSGKLGHLSNAAMTGLFQINEQIEKDATAERKAHEEAPKAKARSLKIDEETEADKPVIIPRRDLSDVGAETNG